MKSRLRKSGLLFAGIFLAGLAITTAQGIALGMGPSALILRSQTLVLLAAIAAFVLSAFISPLRWIQPIVFLALMPLPILDTRDSMYGLGFYAIGVILLERAGFFGRFRLAKVVSSLLYLFAWELISIFRSGNKPIDAVTPVFFITAFLIMLWVLYKDRLVIYLKEPKPILSLSEKGLSPAEKSYVQAVSAGRHPKEIAFDFGISESTVRNTLAHAYKKLGVEDKAGLAALLASHEMEA